MGTVLYPVCMRTPVYLTLAILSLLPFELLATDRLCSGSVGEALENVNFPSLPCYRTIYTRAEEKIRGQRKKGQEQQEQKKAECHGEG